MTNSWRWAGARSIGTSHIRTNTACQDFAGAKLFMRPEGPIIAAVVSDGAGSASHAEAGSKLVCLSFLRACREFLVTNPVEELVEEDVWNWIDEIREAVNARANSIALRPRDFASTLVIPHANFVTRITMPAKLLEAYRLIRPFVQNLQKGGYDSYLLQTELMERNCYREIRNG